MLDTRTGAVRVDGLELVLGPSLTRSALRDHPDAPHFQPFSAAGLRADLELDGAPFVVVLWFDGERLARVALSFADPALAGTSWDDYDPERLRSYHDEWLARHVGRSGSSEHSYARGTVGSYLALQDGNATIVLAYA